MKEEKSMINYEKKQGIMQWIMQRMEKIKNWFTSIMSGKKINQEEIKDDKIAEELGKATEEDQTIDVNMKDTLSEKNLQEIPVKNIREVTMEELEKDLEMPKEIDPLSKPQKKPWSLNEPELIKANTRIPTEETLIKEFGGKEPRGDEEPRGDDEPTI